METISHKRLKQIVKYNKATGLFYRLECFQRPDVIGIASGWHNGNGYLRIAIDGKRYYAHRLAWFYVTGKWPKHEIDHINGKRNDNRWVNIRSATRLMNAQNIKRANSHSRTKVRGVSWSKDKKRFVARIKFPDRYAFLGYFKDIDSARDAYIYAKRAHHSGYVS